MYDTIVDKLHIYKQKVYIFYLKVRITSFNNGFIQNKNTATESRKQAEKGFWCHTFCTMSIPAHMCQYMCNYFLI